MVAPKVQHAPALPKLFSILVCDDLGSAVDPQPPPQWPEDGVKHGGGKGFRDDQTGFDLFWDWHPAFWKGPVKAARTYGELGAEMSSTMKFNFSESLREQLEITKKSESFCAKRGHEGCDVSSSHLSLNCDTLSAMIPKQIGPVDFTSSSPVQGQSWSNALEKCDIPCLRKSKSGKLPCYLTFTATLENKACRIDDPTHPVQANVEKVDNLFSNKSIEEYLDVISPLEKQKRLEQILASQEIGSRIIIFCSTNRACTTLTRSLSYRGDVAAFYGDNSQRDSIWSQFQTGRFLILVATDAAAKDFDVLDVRVVINYDFPESVEDYRDRIGCLRQGGAAGTAFTFFTEWDSKYASNLVKLLQGANQHVPPNLMDMVSHASGACGRGPNSGGGAGRSASRRRYKGRQNSAHQLVPQLKRSLRPHLMVPQVRGGFLTTIIVLSLLNDWIIATDIARGLMGRLYPSTSSSAVADNEFKHFFLWDERIVGLLAGCPADAFIVFRKLEHLVEKEKQDGNELQVEVLARKVIEVINDIEKKDKEEKEDKKGKKAKKVEKDKKDWICDILLLELGNTTQSGIAKIIIDKGERCKKGVPAKKKVRRYEIPELQNNGLVQLGSGGEAALDYVKARVPLTQTKRFLAQTAVAAVEDAYMKDIDTGDGIMLIHSASGPTGEKVWETQFLQIQSAGLPLKERAKVIYPDDVLPPGQHRPRVFYSRNTERAA